MPSSEFYNRKMETLSPTSLRALQNRHLTKQIGYVYSRSPFYKDKLKAAGIHPEKIKTVEDLAKLPFTEKDELRRSQQNNPPLGIHLAAQLEKVVRIHASSGTTGRPTYIPITLRDREIWIEITARSLYAMGIRRGDMVIHAAGLTFFVGGLPVHEAVEEIGATFIPIGTGASARVLSCINDLGARTLHCTPSYAQYLADYVREHEHKEPSELGVEKIVGGAEPGFGVANVRSKIIDDWGVKHVREGLGNSDAAPIVWGECFAGEGMHFCAQEYLYPEIIKPETGDVLELEDGVEGELVYTALEREAVPLLRFRSRDRVKVWTSKCECGRTSFRLRCIGRTDDMLKVLGVMVFPSAIRDVIASLRPKTTGELRILLTQPPPKVDPPLKIKVEYGRGFKGNPGLLKMEVEEALREKLIFKASVELVPEGTLPRFEGKANYIEKQY